jgi:hypothetical protein
MQRILRGVGSCALPCGCLVGFYETYDATTISVVDAKGSACTVRAHQVDATVDAPPARAIQPPSTIPTSIR